MNFVSTPKSQLTHIFNSCITHPYLEYSYFCISPKCLKALCSECLKEHQLFHDKNKSDSKIETLSQVKLRCKDKVDKMFHILSGKMESFLRENTLFSAQSILDESLQRIEKYQQELIQHVNGFFEEFKERYISNMAHLLDTETEFNMIFEKIQKFMNKLQHYRVNIELKNPQEIIKNICFLDLGAILKKCSEDLESLKTLSEQECVLIHKNDSALKEIENSLKRFIYFSKDPKSFDDFRMDTTDTFYENSERKFLHFFAPNTKNLYLFNIDDLNQDQNEELQLKKIDLKIDFNVPSIHESVITAEGFIFLITRENIFKYDNESKNLKLKATLRYPRVNASVVCDSKYIYILGGKSEDEEGEKGEDKCEKFDFTTYGIKDISKIPEEIFHASACLFKGKFIYLFGGKTVNFKHSNKILRYSIALDSWKEINPIVNMFPKDGAFILSYWQKAIQINKREIYIFGSSSDYDIAIEKKPHYIFSKKENIISLLNDDKKDVAKLENYKLFGQPVLSKDNIIVLGKKKNKEDENPNNFKIFIFDSLENLWMGMEIS